MGMKKSVDALLVSALEHEEQHDMENAINDFSKVRKVAPSNIFAMLGMVRCLLRDFDDETNLKKGLKLVKELLDIHDQRNFDVYFLRAKLLWRLGKHSDALHWISLCETRFGKNNPEVLFTKARILVTCQRLDEAEEIMHNLPRRESAFVHGRIEYEKKHYVHASRLFREYIDHGSLCDEDTGSAVINYLWTSIRVHEYNSISQAADIGKKFLDKCKNAVRSAGVAINTSVCLWEKAILAKTKKEKKMCWEKIIKIAQNQQSLKKGKVDWILVRNKEKVYRKLGDLKEARIALDDALSLLKKSQTGYTKRYRQTLFAKGEILLEMKEYNDAIPLFKDVLAYKKKTLHVSKDVTAYIIEKAPHLELKREDVEQARQLESHLKNKIDSLFYASSIDTFDNLALCYEHLGNKKKHDHWKHLAEEGRMIRKIMRTKFTERNRATLRKRMKDWKVDAAKQLGEADPSRPIYDKDEGDTEEHKSSFFYHGDDYKNEDHRKGKDKEHIEEIAESLCSFLNTHGGTIVIGVSDDQECLGIEADIKRTKKGTRDAYIQQVRAIEDLLAEKYPGFIRYHFRDYSPDALGSTKIPLLDIIVDRLPLSERTPAMMNRGGKQVAYFRHAESDQPYSPSEALRQMDRIAEKNRGSY
jgi:tetratricopeptide (TPR) repeat protein